jgi:hypothetical protein
MQRVPLSYPSTLPAKDHTSDMNWKSNNFRVRVVERYIG